MEHITWEDVSKTMAAEPMSDRDSNGPNNECQWDSWCFDEKETQGGTVATLMEDLMDSSDFNINLANPGEHVPHAERNNRTMKERIRALHHGLPFQ